MKVDFSYKDHALLEVPCSRRPDKVNGVRSSRSFSTWSCGPTERGRAGAGSSPTGCRGARLTFLCRRVRAQALSLRHGLAVRGRRGGAHAEKTTPALVVSLRPWASRRGSQRSGFATRTRPRRSRPSCRTTGPSVYVQPKTVPLTRRGRTPRDRSHGHSSSMRCYASTRPRPEARDPEPTGGTAPADWRQGNIPVVPFDRNVLKGVNGTSGTPTQSESGSRSD